MMKHLLHLTLVLTIIGLTKEEAPNRETAVADDKPDSVYRPERQIDYRSPGTYSSLHPAALSFLPPSFPGWRPVDLPEIPPAFQRRRGSSNSDRPIRVRPAHWIWRSSSMLRNEPAADMISLPGTRALACDVLCKDRFQPSYLGR